MWCHYSLDVTSNIYAMWWHTTVGIPVEFPCNAVPVAVLHILTVMYCTSLPWGVKLSLRCLILALQQCIILKVWCHIILAMHGRLFSRCKVSYPLNVTLNMLIMRRIIWQLTVLMMRCRIILAKRSDIDAGSNVLSRLILLVLNMLTMQCRIISVIYHMARIFKVPIFAGYREGISTQYGQDIQVHRIVKNYMSPQGKICASQRLYDAQCQRCPVNHSEDVQHHMRRVGQL
jgi:hypothetical protein